MPLQALSKETHMNTIRIHHATLPPETHAGGALPDLSDDELDAVSRRIARNAGRFEDSTVEAEDEADDWLLEWNWATTDLLHDANRDTD